MTLREEDRNSLIEYRIQKAKEAIEDAQFLLDNDKMNLAVNRINYGMFYILTALALKHKFNTSKHLQLIGWFNKNFVKENLVDLKYGQIIHRTYDKRSRGDYDDYIKFSRDEVLELFQEMKDFIQRIEELIRSDQE